MQILAGPRQVGKTTLVGQVLDDISIPYTLEVADAIDPKDSDWILDSPCMGICSCYNANT